MAKATKPSISALDRSPSHLLHRALQLALDIYALDAESGALTQRQFAVLCAVADDEGLSQTGLVRATGIDRSTLADMVARMIAKGLLARERSVADARANTVRLTAFGRTVLDAATPRVEAADRRLLDLLGAKKREAFMDSLRKLAKAAESALTLDSDDASGETRPKPRAAEDDAAAPNKKAGKKGGKKKHKAKIKAAAPPVAAEDAETIGV
jgi:DNA-binding MarR family transcriptional regulator